MGTKLNIIRPTIVIATVEAGVRSSSVGVVYV